MFIDNFNNETVVNIKKLPPNTCIAGTIALELICRICGLSNKTDEKINSPDYLEVFTDSIADFKVDEKYETTCDIFPEAGVDHKNGIIYYNNKGKLLSATNTKYGFIAGIHYLSASFLFKYFMLGLDRYLENYNKCLELIGMSNKLNMPNSINGFYYGSSQVSLTEIFANKTDECALDEKEISFRPRIEKNAKPKDIKIENFITYKIRGEEIGDYIDRSFNCSI